MLETVHRYYDGGSGLCAFVVDGDERVIGMVSDVQAQRVPKERWAATTARAAMQAVDDVLTVRSDSDLGAVLDQMTASEQEQMPVVDDGRLVGCVSRLQVLAVIAGGDRRTA
jgi:CBS domain-containing protein